MGVLRILKAYDKSCFKFMDHFLRVSFKYKENPFEYDDTAKTKSVKEIMEYIGLKHKPTFMYDYLNPLLAKIINYKFR